MTDQLPAKRTFNEATPPLKRLFGEPSSRQAVAEIVASPGLHAESNAMLPMLEVAVQPCGKRAVVSELAALLAIFPVTDRSEAEWQTFWSAYADDLSDLPLEALQNGIREYRRSAKAEFFPKPGPLRDICSKHATPLRAAHYIAKEAAKLPIQRTWDEGETGVMRGKVSGLIK